MKCNAICARRLQHILSTDEIVYFLPVLHYLSLLIVNKYLYVHISLSCSTVYIFSFLLGLCSCFSYDLCAAIGGFLIGRTLAVLTTITLGTSMAARQGPVAMAAHQICMQVWMAVSLLTDSLAASGQVLNHPFCKACTFFSFIFLVVGFLKFLLI